MKTAIQTHPCFETKPPPFDPRRGYYIGQGYFEDVEGVVWALHAQKGWITIPNNSRSLVAVRKVRVLLRHRYNATKAKAYACAERLGPWAVHSLQLGYQ